MNLTTTNKGFAPATLGEAMDFSQMLAKSAMVPKNYQGKPEDVLVAVQWGYEIGLAPMQALQNISVINGKPSVYGDAAMALVQASPVCEDIEEYFEGEGTANPIAVCIAHRKGRKPVTAKFSVEDAKRAGLWNKQGPWQAYPKRMMQMRARGFALRDAFPDVLKGLITAEEAQDYPDQGEKDITPKAPMRNPLDAIAPPLVVEQLPPVVDELADVNAQLADASMLESETISIDVDPSESKVTIESKPVEGFEFHVPGKPSQFVATQAEWIQAYEDMANKVLKAEKVAPRDRMTKLKELRQANDETIKGLELTDQVNLTASYSKRLKTLGAKMEEAK